MDEDDEWDVDDIEEKVQAQLKEKEKARRREMGLDSESEEEASPKAASAPSPAADKPEKSKPKPKTAKNNKAQAAPAEEDPSLEPALLDPQAEKLRRQKLVEERDARLAGDLFAGCEKSETLLEKEAREKAEREERARKAAAAPKEIVVDLFEKLELKVQADVDNLVETCVKKLNDATAKNACAKFLVDTLKQLDGHMDLKEVTDLEKALAEIVKEKKAQKGAVDAKASKANTKLTKTTKFNTASAWEEVYGGGEGDEEWTQEEWDEWYKQQESAGGR